MAAVQFCALITCFVKYIYTSESIGNVGVFSYCFSSEIDGRDRWWSIMKLKAESLVVAVFLLSACGSSQFTTSSELSIDCRTEYPEQSSSDYLLPYLPDTEYLVGQGNCTDGSHEINTGQAYAYDFDMPIGTFIVASRSGVVAVVVESHPENNGTPGQENYVVVRHRDSSISAYYHLTTNGVRVNVGDLVTQGDIIGQSGNTGDSSEPHLHFEVAGCEDCQTFPINFKNTRSHANGLKEGEAYRAE